MALLWLAFCSAATAQPVGDGSDTIARAVKRLVPAPLETTIDARIPSDTVLSWAATDDWMKALRQAVDSAGLRVLPDFSQGQLAILPGPAIDRSTQRLAQQASVHSPNKPGPVAEASTSTEAPPTRFTVASTETTVAGVLRRWSAVAGLPLAWQSDIDYPVTPRMRGIQAQTLPQALDAMHLALAGVKVPLKFELAADRVRVLKASTATAAYASTEMALAAPLAKPAPDNSWQIGDSATLRAIVERWAGLAGLRVSWEVATDYAVTAAVREGRYTGSFKEALAQLAARFGALPQRLDMNFSSDGKTLRVLNANTP